MTEFETRLNDCLEALTEGRWSVDECLRRNPEHAAELRPHLEAAAMLTQAFDVEPRAEFATAARERFLIATGQRLQEALDMDPEPTFFAAARLRFLMAAQRAKLGERARRQRHLPIFGSPVRALASGMAAVVLFLSFSTYTVASASSALPGDWQYPVKLETERVRVALAFSDGSKRDLKLDNAQERVHELKELTKRGKIIGPGVLDRLAEQTQPLVDDAAAGGWGTDDVARLQSISETQKQALGEAAPQIAPNATDELVKAVAVSKLGVDVSTKLIFADPNRQPAVVTPHVQLTPTHPVSTVTILAPKTPTPATSGTPAAGETPTVASDTPVPTATASGVIIAATPFGTRNNVRLYQLTAGSLRVLVPGAESGWFLVDTGGVTAGGALPTLLKFASAVDAPSTEKSSLVVLNTLNGDMYWLINRNGKVDEVQMRITKGNGIFIADRDLLHSAYGDAANIPLYILDSIEVALDATPTATATPPISPTKPAPTSTASR